MSKFLLFCVDEEAKDFVRKVSKVEYANIRIFWLVETRELPSEDEKMRVNLEEHEEFQTEWIGASVDECREWTLQNSVQTNWIEQSTMAIVDKRSADDDTLSLQAYMRINVDENPPYDLLPPEQRKWYEFRINYKDFATMDVALNHCPPDVTYPTYFGRKQELTNDNGVFDVTRADKLVDES